MRILLFALSLVWSFSLAAQSMLPAADWCASGKKWIAFTQPDGQTDTRSDSVDILSTQLFLDISDFTGKTIDGRAVIQFEARASGVSSIRLDLLGMTIDTVRSDLAPAWTYDGKLLRISWASALAAAEQASLEIRYHGQPAQDASGWGGFYWQGDYAYNLGVGFAADPHSYGRAWFPCFDNFTERCIFRFEIYTPASRPAYCNGYLMGEGPWFGGKIRRQWLLPQPVPAYLACVAAGPFASFKREYPGENGPVPVEIAVAPADSNRLKASFIHLPDALAAFEYWYGPYRWVKVGYSIVPFNQGAMEHATNIAYMRDAVDGTTASERLMAHELSHHWWGDLATCSTAADMWLNEGWAVYSEHLFLENVYGPERFHEEVQKNFLHVLEKIHVNEGGYQAVSGLPHNLTYGDHTYRKGAVVAHNLRGYLGDSLFRAGLRAALEDNQFDDWSSAGFRDKLSAATAYDLHDFFDDWVFQPGFAHFAVDSVLIPPALPGAPSLITVFIKQKRRGAPHFYQQVPLEFTLADASGKRQYQRALVSGENSTVQLQAPALFFPERVWINTRQRLTLARAEKEQMAKNTATYNFSPARMTIQVKHLPADSALIRVEHHYAMPDTAGLANPHGFRLSNRYWTIDALQPFEGEASMIYDGKGEMDQLDTELFDQTGPKEDSILLLFRPGPGHPWLEHPNYSKNTIGSAQDRYGILRALQTPPGQYAIAKGTRTVSAGQPSARMLRAEIAPNPAAGFVRVTVDHPVEQLRVFNARGELVALLPCAGEQVLELNTSAWPAGAYWLWLSAKGRSGIVGPFAVVAQ
ncbi:MAG: M1 family metallopeptidase [Saprospirales bacterium]|nr:M1 family metallopeptidase [Saprospirales bacterium]